VLTRVTERVNCVDNRVININSRSLPYTPSSQGVLGSVQRLSEYHERRTGALWVMELLLLRVTSKFRRSRNSEVRKTQTRRSTWTSSWSRGYCASFGDITRVGTSYALAEASLERAVNVVSFREKDIIPSSLNFVNFHQKYAHSSIYRSYLFFFFFFLFNNMYGDLKENSKLKEK